MNSGTVKWFNADKGFGFISNDNAARYFRALFSNCGTGFKSLTRGRKSHSISKQILKTAVNSERATSA
jgi:cold shock CspA family protein